MAERPSSNLAAGCICQLHFVKRSACRACAQIRFHLIQAEVHKPESQSVAVMYWQGVPFGGASVLRKAPALLALAVRRPFERPQASPEVLEVTSTPEEKSRST